MLAEGSEDAVVALYRDGEAWRGKDDGWVSVTGGGLPCRSTLDADEVAFAARAFDDEADCVVLRPVMPKAFIAAGAGDVEIPEGGKAIAVVDELDKSAVMDLVVVLPGPTIMRRHDGEWREDDKWLRILRSVSPPPIVALDDDQLANVVEQVDEMTAGEEWVETDTDDYITAAGTARADEMTIEFALLAATKVGEKAKAAGRRAKGGSGMPPKLRRYWQHGAGAAKIRWGTPGAMRRCARYLAQVRRAAPGIPDVQQPLESSRRQRGRVGRWRLVCADAPAPVLRLRTPAAAPSGRVEAVR